MLGIGVVWLACTILFTYLPRENELRAILTTLGLLVGFSFVFIGLPILVAAFFTSIFAVARDKGRREGLITLICTAASFLGTLIYLILK